MARGKATARSLKTKAKITKAFDETSQEHGKSTAFTTQEPAKQHFPQEEGANGAARGSIFGSKTLRSPRGSIFSTHNGSAGSISPSLPNFYPGRRFSNLYGHGHLLESTVSSPTQSVTGQKRRHSDSVEGISPKRVRFAASGNDGGQETQLREDFSVAHRDLAVDAAFLSQPDFHLLTALSDVTEPLSINQISSLFRILQKLTGDFAATFFAMTADDNAEIVGLDMQTFPLGDLELKHYALYLTTINVLDASTTDEAESQSQIKNTKWLKFFAHPNYRPFLVTAILSEWLTQRVFKDTAFGLSDKARKEMEGGVDKQYIYFDAFVRAKRRSAVVARHRKKDDADDWLQKACSDLADELMIVLAPMLPFFTSSDPYNEDLSSEDADHKEEIWLALVELIRHCAAFNLAVVRTGKNGTIVRSANRLEKGKRYYPTAPMECINPEMCELARDDTEAGKDERLVIKMSCWPRMEAWVPHGLDRLEMSIAEYDARIKQLPFYLRDKVREGKQLTDKELEVVRKNLFCWDCFDLEDRWDVLPAELWEVDEKHRQKREMVRKSYKLQKKYQREQCKENGGDDDSNHSDSDLSSSTDSCSSSSKDINEKVIKADGEDENAPRGSWVTEYTELAPHQVYCEWAKPENYNAAKIGSQPSKSIDSLQSAVRDARQNLAPPYSFSTKTDDLLLKLWNFYASHNLEIEWATFLVAVVVYISRRGVPDIAAGLITVPFKITSRILDGVCEVLGVKALSRSVIGLANDVAHGFPAFGVSGQLHPGQFQVPAHMLNSANHYLDGNTSVFRTVLWNLVAPFTEAFSSATAQGKVGLSDGLASMTHFVGQRKAFTSNPISKIAGFGSAASSAVLHLDGTLRPAAATSLASAVAAITTRIEPVPMLPKNPWSHHNLRSSTSDSPEASLVPVLGAADELVGEVVEPSTKLTSEHTVSYETDSKTHTTPTTTQSHTSGIWHNAASKVVNVAGDLLLGGKKGGKTITVKPGATVTRMMARGDYQVV